MYFRKILWLLKYLNWPCEKRRSDLIYLSIYEVKNIFAFHINLNLNIWSEMAYLDIE